MKKFNKFIKLLSEKTDIEEIKIDIAEKIENVDSEENKKDDVDSDESDNKENEKEVDNSIIKDIENEIISYEKLKKNIENRIKEINNKIEIFDFQEKESKDDTTKKMFKEKVEFLRNRLEILKKDLNKFEELIKKSNKKMDDLKKLSKK